MSPFLHNVGRRVDLVRDIAASPCGGFSCRFAAIKISPGS
jgi:hypothetical protein